MGGWVISGGWLGGDGGRVGGEGRRWGLGGHRCAALPLTHTPLRVAKPASLHLPAHPTHPRPHPHTTHPHPRTHPSCMGGFSTSRGGWRRRARLSARAWATTPPPPSCCWSGGCARLALGSWRARWTPLKRVLACQTPTPRRRRHWRRWRRARGRRGWQQRWRGGWLARQGRGAAAAAAARREQRYDTARRRWKWGDAASLVA